MPAEVQKDLSVKYVVFCDDIRFEANGKAIFIGVYADDIGVAAFPAQFQLSFWLDVALSGQREHNLKIKIAAGDPEQEIFEFGTSMRAPTGVDRTSLAFGGLPVIFEREGLISIYYSADDGPWLLASRKRVTRLARIDQQRNPATQVRESAPLT